MFRMFQVTMLAAVDQIRKKREKKGCIPYDITLFHLLSDLEYQPLISLTWFLLIVSVWLKPRGTATPIIHHAPAIALFLYWFVTE